MEYNDDAAACLKDKQRWQLHFDNCVTASNTADNTLLLLRRVISARMEVILSQR